MPDPDEGGIFNPQKAKDGEEKQNQEGGHVSGSNRARTLSSPQASNQTAADRSMYSSTPEVAGTSRQMSTGCSEAQADASRPNSKTNSSKLSTGINNRDSGDVTGASNGRFDLRGRSNLKGKNEPTVDFSARRDSALHSEAQSNDSIPSMSTHSDHNTQDRLRTRSLRPRLDSKTNDLSGTSTAADNKVPSKSAFETQAPETTQPRASRYTSGANVSSRNTPLPQNHPINTPVLSESGPRKSQSSNVPSKRKSGVASSPPLAKKIASDAKNAGDVAGAPVKVVKDVERLKQAETSPHALLLPSLSSTQVSAKIPRKGRACDVCRKRKLACDRQNPCARCVRSETSCTYGPSGSSLSSSALSSTIKSEDPDDSIQSSDNYSRKVSAPKLNERSGDKPETFDRGAYSYPLQRDQPGRFLTGKQPTAFKLPSSFVEDMSKADFRSISSMRMENNSSNNIWPGPSNASPHTSLSGLPAWKSSLGPDAGMMNGVARTTSTVPRLDRGPVMFPNPPSKLPREFCLCSSLFGNPDFFLGTDYNTALSTPRQKVRFQNTESAQPENNSLLNLDALRATHSKVAQPTRPQYPSRHNPRTLSTDSPSFASTPLFDLEHRDFGDIPSRLTRITMAEEPQDASALVQAGRAAHDETQMTLGSQLLPENNARSQSGAFQPYQQLSQTIAPHLTTYQPNQQLQNQSPAMTRAGPFGLGENIHNGEVPQSQQQRLPSSLNNVSNLLPRPVHQSSSSVNPNHPDSFYRNTSRTPVAPSQMPTSSSLVPSPGSLLLPDLTIGLSRGDSPGDPMLWSRAQMFEKPTVDSQFTLKRASPANTPLAPVLCIDIDRFIYNWVMLVSFAPAMMYHQLSR